MSEKYTGFEVSENSRYILTDLYLDDAVVPGRLRFGLWDPPNIEVANSFDTYTIKKDDIKRLDRIAYQFYRDSSLWWAIAIVNSIANPLEDLQIGQSLTIPTLEAINKAMVERT